MKLSTKILAWAWILGAVVLVGMCVREDFGPDRIPVVHWLSIVVLLAWAGPPALLLRGWRSAWWCMLLGSCVVLAAFLFRLVLHPNAEVLRESTAYWLPLALSIILLSFDPPSRWRAPDEPAGAESQVQSGEWLFGGTLRILVGIAAAILGCFSASHAYRTGEAILNAVHYQGHGFAPQFVLSSPFYDGLIVALAGYLLIRGSVRLNAWSSLFTCGLPLFWIIGLFRRMGLVGESAGYFEPRLLWEVGTLLWTALAAAAPLLVSSLELRQLQPARGHRLGWAFVVLAVPGVAVTLPWALSRLQDTRFLDPMIVSGVCYLAFIVLVVLLSVRRSPGGARPSLDVPLRLVQNSPLKRPTRALGLLLCVLGIPLLVVPAVLAFMLLRGSIWAWRILVAVAAAVTVGVSVRMALHPALRHPGMNAIDIVGPAVCAGVILGLIPLLVLLADRPRYWPAKSDAASTGFSRPAEDMGEGKSELDQQTTER